MPQPECTREFIRFRLLSEKRRLTLTSTNVEDTSGNPSDGERGGLRPGRKDAEQSVDDVFLTHQDGDEKIGDDGVGNLSGVCLVGRRETNEYGHVGREGDTEKPSVNGEEHIAEVPDRLGVLLLDVLLIEITLPVEGLLFIGDILRRVTGSRSRDSFLGFCSSREIDDFGFPGGWLWGGDIFTTARKREVNNQQPKESQRKSTHGPLSVDIPDT